MSLPLTLILMLLGGWLAGRLFKVLRLPAVLGMLVWGITLSLVAGSAVPASLAELAPFLKSLALVVILLRAGLGLPRADLKQIGGKALLLGLLPAAVEGLAIFATLSWFFHWDLLEAATCGSLMAALSPAVVVPTMLQFQAEGRGQARRVPTVILGAASLDNVLAVTLISLCLDIGRSADRSFSSLLWQVPLNLAGGILPGLLLGLGLAWYFRRRHHTIRATEKALVLLTLMLLMLQMGEWFHTVAILGVLTAGFCLVIQAPAVATETAAKLAKAWIPAEIILFVLIGLALPLDQIGTAWLPGLTILALGLGVRSLAVYGLTRWLGFTGREQVFTVLANLPKATIQAAFAAVPLSLGFSQGRLILAFGILSILVTSPLGLISLNLWGRRLMATDSPPSGPPTPPSAP